MVLDPVFGKEYTRGQPCQGGMPICLGIFVLYAPVRLIQGAPNAAPEWQAGT